MLPDFVVIGAPRSGTTWLHKQLSLHPDVFLPENKEPRYFAVHGAERPTFSGPGDDIWSSGLVSSRDEYEALFAGADGRRAGEASTDYLYRGEAAAAMRALVPDVRIVAILREPVVRAHSAWRLLVHSGHETLSFEDGLAAEAERIEAGWAWWWHFSRHGFYARNLRPYLEAFPADQLLLLPYDGITGNPQAFLDRVTDHIGVSRLMGSQLAERVNEAPLTRGVRKTASRGVLRSTLTRVVPAPAWRAARGLLDRATLYKPPVDDRSRSSLEALYAADQAELEELTGQRFELSL